jgi:hypothetical protein
MKYLLFIFCLLIVSRTNAIAQKKGRKLTTVEMSTMTQEQRMVHEEQRKAGKDQKLSTKRKMKIQKKQARKSERMRQPKPSKRKR